MKKIIFISDAHLKNCSDPEYKDLIKFFEIIENNAYKVGAILILGDLFDFFIAFPQVIFFEHMQILSIIERLAKRGIKIFYFEGNHDFFLKKLSSSGFPAEIIQKDMILNLGEKFYVSHGDMLNPNDYMHRFLSFLVRNPITYILAYFLPPYIVYHFAHWFSKFSRKNISGKQRINKNIFNHIAPSLVKRGVRGAIVGHFHLSKIIDTKYDSFSFYLLGSWQKDRSYLVYDLENKVMEYKNFNMYQEHL